MRKCGPCNLCCVIPAIPQLNKPADTPCEHLTKDGCGIYEDRPQVCRDFACNWLAGVTDEWIRPDIVGAYVTRLNAGDGMADTERGLMIRALADQPRRFERFATMQRMVANETSNGGDVLVAAGDSRRILTRRSLPVVHDQDGRPVLVETY